MNTSATKRVIINADDYGFSAGVTDGILRAHREGVLTSTTIAANMPAAADAVRRLAEAPRLGVGVHLNVSQGPPLSAGGRRLAGERGIMDRTATGVILAAATKPWMISSMLDEFRAQIEWVLDHGVHPTHLDSHRHSHGFPPIFHGVAKLAKHYNIRFVRWYRESLAGTDWPAAESKQRRICSLLNMFGRVNGCIPSGRLLRGTLGTWGISHTGSLDAAWLIRVAAAAPFGVIEIMTHPGYADDLPEGASRLRESRRMELEALCDGAVREAFAKQGIELVHYGQL